MLTQKITSLWHHFISDSLYRNSFYLLFNTGFTALTGFVFWALAAKLFAAHDVGITSTLITASTFIASASIFGLDHTLIQYIAKHKKHTAKIVNTALTIATIGAVVFSLAYLAFIPLLAPELSFLTNSFLWVSIFFIAMLITTWNNLLNSTFIGLRACHFILFAGLAFGITRIALLWTAADKGLLGLFGVHMLAFAIGVAVCVVSLTVVRRYLLRPQIAKNVVRLIRGYSLQTYTASLLASIPPLITPIIVLTLLGASQTAYYYMPLMIIGLLTIIPLAINQSLFAEGATDSVTLKRHITRSIKLAYLLLIPAVLLVIIAGNPVLHIFGAGYAEHGYLLLVLLSIAALFKAGSYSCMAILRILGDIKEIILITISYVIISLLGTYLALNIFKELWVVGFAMLCAEIITLVMYAIILRTKWPNIRNIDTAKNHSQNEELLNA